MRPITQCENCGGLLHLVHIDVEERKRRRLGGSWVARCERCGGEEIVVPEAWKMERERERERGRGRTGRKDGQRNLWEGEEGKYEEGKGKR
jgi:hypothetical protein